MSVLKSAEGDIALIFYEIKITQAQVEYPLALSLALAAVWSHASDSWMLLLHGVLSFFLTGAKFLQVRSSH